MLPFLVKLGLLLVAAIPTTIFLVAIAMGVLFLLHKHGGERFGDSDIGQFSFDNFGKSELIDLVLRMGAVVAASLVGLLLFPLVIDAFKYNFINRNSGTIILTIIPFLAGAIFAGLFLWMRVDRVRSGIVAGVIALIYPVFHYLLLSHALS